MAAFNPGIEPDERRQEAFRNYLSRLKRYIYSGLSSPALSPSIRPQSERRQTTGVRDTAAVLVEDVLESACGQVGEELAEVEERYPNVDWPRINRLTLWTAMEAIDRYLATWPIDHHWSYTIDFLCRQTHHFATIYRFQCVSRDPYADLVLMINKNAKRNGKRGSRERDTRDSRSSSERAGRAGRRVTGWGNRCTSLAKTAPFRGVWVRAKEYCPVPVTASVYFVLEASEIHHPLSRVQRLETRASACWWRSYRQRPRERRMPTPPENASGMGGETSEPPLVTKPYTLEDSALISVTDKRQGGVPHYPRTTNSKI
ncbi:hypothetical protein AAG570_007569 [Ranatra chinensis]|uniref:Uncharacterized protein n=1 Tax=Ranatra chinensis TaxID=642074 RepID=A0ABD0XYX0_9HEMI